MDKKTHINITIDFTNWGGTYYDLRIPIQITVKQLILNLQEIFMIENTNRNIFILKILTKNLLLADDDILEDFRVTDGDIIVVH